MSPENIDAEQEQNRPDAPQDDKHAGHTDDTRASIVFAVMQLNRPAGEVSYENRDDFIEVIKNADFITLQQGAVIVQPGMPADRLFLILEGSAVVAGAGGVAAVHEKGAVVGREQLLGSEPYGAPVTAGDAGASLLVIHKETLLDCPAVYRDLLGSGLVIKGRDCAYELGKKLGEGARGPVFAIHDHSLCAKIYRARPDAEAAAAIPENILQLRHPHIISIHETVCTDAAQFVIMDLARGVSLRTKEAESVRCHNLRQMMEAFRVEGQRISLDMIGRVFRHVAAALLYIHQQGYAHRDVKPEHIFIDAADNDISFKLSDFSLAFPISTRPGSIQGTPHYCPPEALHIDRPETLITGSADFYSLAAVCFELLTGTTVFGSDNVLELARQHLEAEPDLSNLPSETPIWLAKFIEQALKKKPDERATDEDIAKLVSGI